MRRQNVTSERGAIFVNTVMIVGLSFGIAAFVLDYGAFWIGRHQAQNAADAGAMAGAVARAYDDFDDTYVASAEAPQNALLAATTLNPVWNSTPTATAAYNPCPPSGLTGADRCVQVDVSTSVPTWFAHVWGVTTQPVNATATARVLAANATDCMRPWAIPDKWSGASYTSGGAFTPPGDTYAPPDTVSTGTGLQFPADLGHAITPITLLTLADLGNPMTNLYPGSLIALDLPGTGYNPSACNGQPVTIGALLPVSATSPGTSEFGALYDLDSSASWSGQRIDGSCAPACAPFSPRLVAVVMYDVDILKHRVSTGVWTSCPLTRPGCAPCPGGPNSPCATVANIAGFFIGDSTGSSGNVTSYPGLVSTDAPKLMAQSSFLKAVTLVR